MKKIFFLLSMLLSGLSTNVRADADFRNVYTYLGAYGTGNFTSIVFRIDVLTPEGFYYGTYSQGGYAVNKGIVPNLIWTGPGSPPELSITSNASVVNDSYCPGMDTNGWTCMKLAVNIHVYGEAHGCPWLVTTSILSKATFGGEFLGPKANQSTCPAVPLAPYDISWNENYVVHDKVLRLQSTGSTIETTLSTYLMKDGKLCDGSKFGDTDDRGAYCRWVSQMLTFTSSGCDNAKVTVTPNRHPITDKELHDMVLRVDTTSRQPIDSTCRFQYVLNML
ncbi:StfH/YfcO family fimbrial adhesin [Escherichia coli]|uniref:StfH/YfcO family fimbrial adhesin n=1 Tax=Escherichia coli TaxID=562 RepID=UPI0006A1268D|nr:StfH/YfcO family fimbrial adhesin [Escherichia coli]EIH5001968.1 DUF2544 domain-containing protein [Shigella boydii]EFA4797720.1 DUF2544 domain-containing protein [Escherichia coli]EFH3309968.1 DUF2544 domain-containing protein [Escherichia coli]EFK3804283.1 DUF2544 domain-containing protein [Escherichia coli]EGE1764626.1 DUF2544 domain-containing protein [Escherichia coli]